MNDDAAKREDEPNAPLTRIVIVGGGYAGAYCAAALERKLGHRLRSRSYSGGDVEVVLIDPRNYFIIYPLLIEAGTGSLEPRHAVVSIRSFLSRSIFRMGEVTGIDYDERRVQYTLRSTDSGGDATLRELRYDHVVICPGSVTMKPDVPGLREYGLEVKSLSDAVALRDRAIRLMERADGADDAAERRRLLHFVVVGANFTGAELAGEFHEFLQRLSRMYPSVSEGDCRMTLIEKSDRILRALSGELSEFAEAAMRKRGIDIRLNETVARLAADHVMLSTGERLDTETCIWCAGIAPNPLISTLGLPVDPRGYILCERDCRVRGFVNVWAIGDCAVNIDARGEAYPATAQHAIREGKHVVKQIARVLAGRDTQPFDYTTQGALAALGCRTGVAEVMGVKLSGFWAWWLWRTVYLLKMPGLARKLRIAIDWTLDLLFRRDDVQLGVHRSERAQVK